MPRTKKIVEPKIEVAIEESTEKKNFRKLIERFKAQDPAKYALKEQELLTKLNTL